MKLQYILFSPWLLQSPVERSLTTFEGGGLTSGCGFMCCKSLGTVRFWASTSNIAHLSWQWLAICEAQLCAYVIVLIAWLDW